MTKNPPPTDAELRAAVDKFRRLLPNHTERYEGSCLVWKSALKANGKHNYGLLNSGGRVYGCHRLAVLNYGMELPPNSIVTHQCLNRACVQPGHLTVTMRAADQTTNAIAKLRRSLGLTQKQFAEALGARPYQVAGWEHDRYGPSSAVIMRAIRLWGSDWLTKES